MSRALVTGATSGIGLAFAVELARRGHDLVLVARDVERLEAAAVRLRARGVDVEVLPADLSDRDQLARVAERVASSAAPVDLLVNNAGFGLNRDFLASDVDDEVRAVDVMVTAVLVLSHAAGTAMRERGHGAIVNVSSVASFVRLGAYSAAKSWVTTFTEGLANELRGSGVTATALCPGFTHTEFHQRAGMDMGHLPEVVWLDADRLVRDCLADVARGRALSVPGPLYKLAAAVTGVTPRPALRAVSRAVAPRHRPR